MSNLMSADERRRQKELDEARKAGLAPAERDEDGREINPHIPQYMTSAPWYLNKDKPTLTHQRNWNKKDEDDDKWYDRGAKVFQATKWRKGACENCGSMTHKTKDCLERPRAKGAKFTNMNIAADDKVEDIRITGFDAKRDRWNGYDAKEYAQVVERHEQLEALRKEMKQKETAKQLYNKEEGGAGGAAPADGPSSEGGGEDEDEDTKIREEEDAGFAKVEKRVRTTAGGSTGSVRNLRIREDTAKYLLNLDLDSAYYDPKTRSMREDPTPHIPTSQKTFAGDNFVRKSGDYAAWQALQVHVLASHDKGVDLNVAANPSLAEKLYQQFKARKEGVAKAGQQAVVAKYGNAAEKPPEDLALLGGTEKYVEYDRQGRVVRGQENKARSRYEEDVLTNNHTAVWGSWWQDGVWGYACCHQTVRNSYCTGSVGKAVAAASGAQMLANMEAKAAEADAALLKRREESKLNNITGQAGQAVDVWGADTADVPLDDAKVKAALAKLDRHEREALEADGNKRKFNLVGDAAAGGQEVTPEEMEAWRLKRARGDDPLLLAAAGKPTAATAVVGGYELLE